MTLMVGATLAGAAPEIPAGWFAWPAAEPVDGSALDTRALNRGPADAPISVRDGQYVNADGQRVRFWGANLSSGENFLDADSAVRMARRLAKGGINIVRLHHLDNNWSVASRGSIWSPDDPGRIAVDPQQLDKLFRLVAELKKEGIYSNVNLKVSRTLSVADGFPETITQLPQFQKRVDYYDARMIELQKDYARQVLGTRNPYTGLTLAEDPAVAIVEINNENSLLGMRTRDVGRDLHLFPDPFKSDLAKKWNAWLTEKYPVRATLEATWKKGATPMGRNAITPASRWHADPQPGNEVVVQSDPTSQTAVQFEVTVSDTVRWRSAAFLDRLELADGQTYTVTFSARADAARPVAVALGRDDAGWRTDKWRTRGLVATIPLTPEWKTFRFVVNTHSVVDAGTRFNITAGHQRGSVWLKDLKIESGSPTAGLAADQDPAKGNVPIPTDATPAQWNHWLTFLTDLEVKYVDEMRAYLRDRLKVKAPIVCSQANYGGIAGLARERASDFIDAHSYWQHPDFGGLSGAWDLGNFTINNSPQIGEFSPRWFGELGGIALLRVAGKPFSVTEVDNPAPSDYACEMYPLLATLAAVQDWDALYPFDIVGLGEPDPAGTIKTFFDQNHHPVKWGFAPFATRAFRHGLFPPAGGSRELFVGQPLWEQANHVDVLWLRQQPGQDLGFLTERLSVNENLTNKTRVEKRGKPGSVARLERTPRGVIYRAETPEAATIIGYVGGGKVEGIDLSLDCDAFGLNFAAVTAVSLEDKPMDESARVLITLGARAENNGAKWNASRTSIGESWGAAPTVAERVPADVRLRVHGLRNVYALAPDGSRAARIEARYAGGWLTFSTREGPATLHYEIVREKGT